MSSPESKSLIPASDSSSEQPGGNRGSVEIPKPKRIEGPSGSHHSKEEIINLEENVKGEFVPVGEKTGKAESKERRKSPVQWKLGREADTLDFEALEERKVWLEEVLTSSSLDMRTSHIRQELSETMRRNLLKIQKGDPQTVLDRKINDPKVFERAVNIVDKLEVKDTPTNVSMLHVLEEAKDIKDLQAIRLLGLSLLEEGYSGEKQKTN
jgi:hypothetical protein